MPNIGQVPARETWQKEGFYVSHFLDWKGRLRNVPLIRATFDATADAVCASWRTTGQNAGAMAKILDSFRGTGKETFKTILHNLVLQSMIGGDAYAEILISDDGDVEDLITLPPDNVRQIIKNGRIVKYELTNQDGPAVEFKIEKVLHIRNDPCGAMTHGESEVEKCQNLIVDLEQITDTGSRIYESYSKPTRIVYMNTDDPTELATMRSTLIAVNKTGKADMVIPKGNVDHIEVMSVPPGSTLDPAHWERLIRDHLVMGRRVPELALGTGSANSEESAIMQFTGFRQMVRWKQQQVEEALETQLFNLQFPEETPHLRLSFATEAQEETYRRHLETINMLAPLPPDAINPQGKPLLIMKELIDMGVIPNE